MSQNPVPLSTLKQGNRATISDLTNQSRRYRAKLLAMGMTPGTMLRIVRLAPMGDPIELDVRGYRLSLRRQECSAVMVQPAPAEKAMATTESSSEAAS
jgi:ferrous iron transport protein A